jgi:dTDP-4-dehydrorhamnose reductase
MKVLILGAGGLTGRYLVREAKRRGMEVVAFTRQELDISKSDAARETLAKVNPELVINAASVTSLETCEENPVLSRKANCEAPEEWAKECGRAGVCFVHLGTDYIFAAFALRQRQGRGGEAGAAGKSPCVGCPTRLGVRPRG